MDCQLLTTDQRLLLQQTLQQRTSHPPLQIKTLAKLAAAVKNMRFRQNCQHFSREYRLLAQESPLAIAEIAAKFAMTNPNVVNVTNGADSQLQQQHQQHKMHCESDYEVSLGKIVKKFVNNERRIYLKLETGN